ncbi:magnesium transporter [Neoehrlichia mikurensis]|uniref:Magnesium transporter MgtE n=1 Tax=Neoehrlichia mikurensis TaxID=89586 RepID=A0A9Q9BXA8_9RICK|nr:magnesium transporter [Neoehrlichia mikurensis]QXK91898.1 magnesium transporter [Neoehrlichia mikurensis]QXK93111.1 magnesium transporter [Neoehrlichia mikurensis]QXK93591.1 magnesium transporter [Neoehrlichia mikurensis]UTO55456.1 magnesium transporter [Neoehrlichia mikurensis]UTO56376.1 magnesium transporter [Neoehrlichia mikurensis]
MSSYLLNEEISNLLIKALEDKDSLAIKNIINKVDNVQIAYFLITSTYQYRKELLLNINDKLLSETLVHLVPELHQEIINIVKIEKFAFLISDLDTEDIVTIIEGLYQEEQTKILNLLPNDKAIFIKELLSYPEQSAGRLIHKDIAIVPEHWNISQLIDYLCNSGKSNNKFYEIFVINSKLQPIGMISLDVIIRANKYQLIRQLMNTDIKIIKPGITQEEVSEIFRKYSLLSAPVVNKKGHIIGSILIHDIINVIQQEAEQDVLHLGMVSNNDINSSLFKTVIKRLPWLAINLLTSTISSMVINLFSNTIKQFVVLSVIMPIIASMSGNAGLQALTVTIRALATKQINYRNSHRLLMKELCVGFFNGLVLASIASMIIIIRFHNITMEILFSISMIITFSIATFLGASIPIILNFFKSDPTVSSSIIICAASDTISFLIFLGLSTIFLM